MLTAMPLIGMLLPGLAIIVAAAFRGVTGFGYALIAAIGLSSSLQPNAMIPIILINDLLLTGLILTNRKQGSADWSITPMLLGFGFLGAISGGLLSGFMDATTTKLIVAGVVCLSALLGMVHNPPTLDCPSRAWRLCGLCGRRAAGRLRRGRPADRRLAVGWRHKARDDPWHACGFLWRGGSL